VAVRQGKRTRVEAISGADVVEKRSNLVQLMRTLFDRVICWGEKLVYSGTKDDTLPPDVLKALDEYLAESNSKLLCVLPLKDERESESKKPCRSAMMMECFEPNASPDQLVARLEVVGKHAVSGLYNAVEHRRIPMRFVWAPLAKVQDGLGGKARAIIACIAAALIILVGVLVFVKGPLKVDAKGKLVPKVRGYVFASHGGKIIEFAAGLKPNSPVIQNQDLVRMYDQGLANEVNKLKSDIQKAKNAEQLAADRYHEAKTNNRASPQDLAAFQRERNEAHYEADFKGVQLRNLQQIYNASVQSPGEFWLKSPMSGTILSPDFREVFKGKTVGTNEPILHIGHVTTDITDWEVELRIPQKNVGQVLAEFASESDHPDLDIDLLLMSDPTHVYRGKLARIKVSPEANPSRDDNNESEPVVIAWVRLTGEDIPDEDRVPEHKLLTGTEVHAKVRCGQHALGYTLFYGVWEFFYEKIIFFF
jgi:hypothetical protein